MSSIRLLLISRDPVRVARAELTNWGTLCSQLLNEIMPMIYKRFTEKTAEEWRQIYKVYLLVALRIPGGQDSCSDAGMHRPYNS